MMEYRQSYLKGFFRIKQYALPKFPWSNLTGENNVLYLYRICQCGLQLAAKNFGCFRNSDGTIKNLLEERVFLFGTDKYGRDYLSQNSYWV